MIKKFIEISFIFYLMSFLTSCGYEPLNKKLNLNKMTISGKTFSGDKQINRRIFNKLNLEESKNSSNYKIKLDSAIKVLPLSKDQSGNVISYKTIITVNVTLTKNVIILKDKTFEKSKTYSNLSNKFELSKYQNDIQNNIINSIAQDIRIFLN